MIDAKEGGDAIVHKLRLVAHGVAVKGREFTAKVHRVVIELVSQAMLNKIQINTPRKTKEGGCGPAQHSAQRHCQASGPDARVSNYAGEPLTMAYLLIASSVARNEEDGDALWR